MSDNKASKKKKLTVPNGGLFGFGSNSEEPEQNDSDASADVVIIPVESNENTIEAVPEPTKLVEEQGNPSSIPANNVEDIKATKTINPPKQTTKAEVPEVKKEVKKYQPPAPKKEDPETDATDSLDEIVQYYIEKIENKLMEDSKPKIELRIGRKVKFEEKYPTFTTPAMKEFDEVLDQICKHSPMKKYEVFQYIMLNGLKNTRFS